MTLKICCEAEMVYSALYAKAFRGFTLFTNNRPFGFDNQSESRYLECLSGNQ